MDNERNLTLKHQAAPRALVRRWACGLAASVMLVLAAACRDGEGVVIGHLAFEGVHQVSELELRLAVTTTGSSKLPWGQKTHFSKQEFSEDLKRLEAFYISRGFPDARVTSFRTKYNADKTQMDLTVVIDEGQPTVIDTVELIGFDALPASHLSSLRSRMALVPGQPRDRERVEVVRGMALDELRDHGYPAATVSIRERAGSAPRSVVVSYTAMQGTFARFGDVVVHGNTSVGADVIMRQLAFTRGDEFSLSAVKASQRRLYNLELFQFANVETEDAASTPGEVTIKITVIEAPHRRLTFGVGYGSEDHARVQANWRHVNFLGGARTAGVEGKYSSLDRGVRLSLTEPAFGGGFSLAASGQSWYANTPAYTLHTSGLRLGLLRSASRGELAAGQRALHSMSVTLAREYESYRVSDAALADRTFRPTLIALGLNPLTGEGAGTVSSVMADMQRNTVGNILDAKSGSLMSIHGEAAGRVLGGDFRFQEMTGEIRAYRSVSESIVLAAHARAGAISAGSDRDTSVPFFKRYFLGGATSLRGWGRFEVAPLTPDGLPIGGYSMLETSAEVRLTPNLKGAFGVVAFVDAGNVWNQSWRVYFNDLRSDAGVGLRYRTPVGPLRFDLAYQLKPIQDLVVLGGAPGAYRRWRFHFSIGQAF